MGGRPWEDNSHSGMRLNYLQRVHLQTKKNGQKQKYWSKGYFSLTNTGVAECVWIRNCLVAPKLQSKKKAPDSPVKFFCLWMSITWLTIWAAGCFCFLWLQVKTAVSDHMEVLTRSIYGVRSLAVPTPGMCQSALGMQQAVLVIICPLLSGGWPGGAEP